MRRAVATAASFALAAIAACSLDLDASRLAVVDAGGSDSGALDVVTPVSDADARARGDGVACTVDADCVLSNACGATGRCDVESKVCVYAVCAATAACQSSSCDPKASLCTAPKPYGFHAATARVTLGGVGCGSPSRCLAAVYPFVFVGTTNGAVAYSVSDSVTSMPEVAISGVPFVPVRVASVGRRVYFFGNVNGIGPTARVPVAWIDVPGNPLLGKLTARSALLTTPPTNLGALLPAPAVSLFVVNTDPAKLYPASILQPLGIDDTTVLAPFANAGAPGDVAVVASSGSRLVFAKWDGPTWRASFALGKSAGTGSAQYGADLPAAAMGTVNQHGTFAQEPGGGVLWMASAGPVVAPDNMLQVTNARMTWLLADGAANALDVAVKVDLETYSPLGSGTNVTGPLAWIDGATALATAQAKEDRAKTSVQVASRMQSSPGLVAGRRFVVDADTSRVALVSANGFGYLLAQDEPNTGAALHVFAPNCN